MSSGIWTKAMIQNQKDLGTDLSILFPESSLDNYIYLERYYIKSRKRYEYNMYTVGNVIKDIINKESYTDYVLIHKDKFNTVFDILSEAPND